jgi:hypothetical protein
MHLEMLDSYMVKRVSLVPNSSETIDNQVYKGNLKIRRNSLETEMPELFYNDLANQL